MLTTPLIVLSAALVKSVGVAVELATVIHCEFWGDAEAVWAIASMAALNVMVVISFMFVLCGVLFVFVVRIAAACDGSVRPL